MARLDPRLWGERQTIDLKGDWPILSEEERRRKADEMIAMIREMQTPLQPPPLVYRPQEAPDDDEPPTGGYHEPRLTAPRFLNREYRRLIALDNAGMAAAGKGEGSLAHPPPINDGSTGGFWLLALGCDHTGAFGASRVPADLLEQIIEIDSTRELRLYEDLLAPLEARGLDDVCGISPGFSALRS